MREFSGKPVTFISLSVAGGEVGGSGEPVTIEFLKKWRQRHEIPATVIVAESPGDAGKVFFRPDRFPSVAVVNKQGNLYFKGLHQPVDVTLGKVRELLR